MPLLASTKFAGTGATSAAIDTSGAKVLIAVFASGNPTDLLHDSETNTWIGLTEQDSAFGCASRIFYVLNPITSIVHTFNSLGGSVPSAVILAFDDVVAFDQQTGTVGNLPLATGSITPADASNLLITGIGGGPIAVTPDSGYTYVDGNPLGGGLNFGTAIAYLYQVTATAQNPTWSGSEGATNGGLSASFKVSAGPPPTNPYTYSKLVTIDFTQCGSSNSTNFKAVIRKVIPELRTVANGGLINNTDTANGQLVPADFQVYTDLVALTKANFEIPYYNQVTGEIEIWYNNPLLDHTNNTLASLAFGAPSITTYQGSAPATFASPYKLAAHLPNGTTLSAIDSSAGAHNGTITGALAAAGNIDGAASFNGSSALINFGASADWNFAGSFTISVWVKVTVNNDGFILGINNGIGTFAWQLTQTSSPGAAFSVSGVGSGFDFSPINDGVWHWLVGQFDTGAGHVVLWVDGSVVSTAGSGSFTGSSSIALIAGIDAGASFDHYAGLLDEIHVVAALLSSSWIIAEYNNQKPNSTFLVLGPLVPPIPVVIDMAYTQALQLGLPTAILQNIVYALPARACFVQCTAAVEVSNIIDSGFATLTNANTVGAETAATWIRCTTGNATITVKSL